MVLSLCHYLRAHVRLLLGGNLPVAVNPYGFNFQTFGGVCGSGMAKPNRRGARRKGRRVVHTEEIIDLTPKPLPVVR
jgi:hypothetical protein